LVDGVQKRREKVTGRHDGDRTALEELRQSSQAGAVHSLLHYLYFPRRADADAAAAELRKGSVEVEQRRGADGTNWLVLARQNALLSDTLLAAIRDSMEDLAERGGGEYDGWEAATLPQK
jgi:hypothetical protein